MKNKKVAKRLAAALGIIMLIQQISGIHIFAAETSAGDLYSWDFETTDSCKWYASGNYDINYRYGIAEVETSKDTGNGYIAIDTEGINTSIYKYLVVEMRNKGTSESITVEYTTENGAMEKDIAVDINQSVFSEYCADLSADSSWKGTLKQIKLKLGNGGEVEIEKIYLADNYKALSDYHFNLSNPLDFTGTVIYDEQDDLLTVNGRQNNYFFLPGSPRLAAGTLPAEDYNYVTISFKNSTIDETTDISVFPIGPDGLGDESMRVRNHEIRKDGEHTYVFFDVGSQVAQFKDGMQLLRIDLCSSGIYQIDDVYVSAKKPEIDKFAVYPDSYSISEDGGSIEVKPYIRKSDGTLIDDYSSVMWAVDSICAQPIVKEDKTLELTGKLDGSVKVTGYFTYQNSEYEADCVIEVSSQSEKTVGSKIKLMTYGNSIHYHQPNESLGWAGNWGMAASSQEKDYVHRLISYLEQKYGEGSVEWVMGTGQGSFESDTTDYTETQDLTEFLKGIETCARNEQPDIITVQFGENSHCENAVAYENAMTQFVKMLKKGAPDAVVLITTPFWGGDAKINGANAAAEKLNIPIADLAVLTTAENEALDGPDEWTSGVKIHPGDLGMDRIAQAMYKEINKYLTMSELVTYTAPQTDIRITSTESQITEDGQKLQLAAEILPAEADQTIIWSSSDDSIASVDSNGTVTPKRNGTVTVTAASAYNPDLSASIDITVSGQSPLYKITYSANTDDEVTALPEPEETEGRVSLEGKYPSRSTYRFLGWSLTNDGDVVDSVEVTEDTTLYAVWEKAELWDFERDGYNEGFTVDYGFNQYIADGRFRMMATNTDEAAGAVLQINSPELSLASDDYSLLQLKLQNTNHNSDTKIKVTINTDEGAFTFEKPVITSSMATYDIDLSDVKGTITGFNVRPTNVDCTVYLDDIKFIKNETVGSDPLRLLKPDQTTGVIDSWEGTQALADDAAENASTAFEQRLIEFADGSYWGFKNTDGADWTYGNKVEYKQDTGRSLMQLKAYSPDEGAMNIYFHLGKSLPSADVKKIVLGINSSRDIGNFRMRFRQDGGPNEAGRYFSVALEQGFHEYTIDVSSNQYWDELDTYDYFQCDYEDQYTFKDVTDLEVAYIRFVDDTYTGSCDVSGSGTWIENGTLDYDRADTIVDVVLPEGKSFAPGTAITSDRITINGRPVKWAICGTDDRVRVNLGRLNNNTQYTVGFDGVYYSNGIKASGVFTFSVGEAVSYDSIGVLKNGESVSDIASVAAGDELEIKIDSLNNRSCKPVALNIIPAIYGEDGKLINVSINPVTIDAQSTVQETTLKINVPEDAESVGKISVFIWNSDPDMSMMSEVADYYTLQAGI